MSLLQNLLRYIIFALTLLLCPNGFNAVAQMNTPSIIYETYVGIVLSTVTFIPYIANMTISNFEHFIDLCNLSANKLTPKKTN